VICGCGGMLPDLLLVWLCGGEIRRSGGGGGDSVVVVRYWDVDVLDL
jgi:hypothetical protein